VAVKLPAFRHDRPGDSFRAWLATVSRNAIRDHFKLRAGRPAAIGGSEMHRLVQDLPDLDATESIICARSDSNASVVRSAIAAIQDEFEPHTWLAFWKTAVDGLAPTDVAAQLGVTKWVVYQAKSRVLRRLRKELEGLVE
jgi:RNA polymerase sigma-70 factor (ECF subfamily)